MSSGELWHWTDGVYRLVDSELVSRPRSERVKIDGRMVEQKLPPLEFTIVTCVPVVRP